tara:strand:- start:70 stop:357 length:288 start_codon:yes stop_codon:yes gene_type:complete
MIQRIPQLVLMFLVTCFLISCGGWEHEGGLDSLENASEKSIHNVKKKYPHKFPIQGWLYCSASTGTWWSNNDSGNDGGEWSDTTIDCFGYEGTTL